MNYRLSGEINCIYSINNTKINTSLLSKEFENINNSIINIYINNNKIKFKKEYQFSLIGNYDIKYELNSEVILDKMFKGINSLISVVSIKVYTNSSIKILSMKSVFENCLNLQNISMNSFFDTSELKSMSKLFYNSGINFINIKNFNMENIEDISYMFSLSNLNNIEFFKYFNIINVKNITGIFEGCKFLENINLFNFNCENIEDISCMFENCFNLKRVNFENFNGKRIIIYLNNFMLI